MLLAVMAWFRKYRVVIAIGLATSVVATYLVRGLDWMLPRLVGILIAAPEWLYLFVVVVSAVCFSAFATATLAMFIRRVSRQLIVWASARLPRYLRRRYRDEWIAEIELFWDRPFGGLVFATRIWAASISMSRDMFR